MEGWRIRIGKWRVIYYISDQAHIITIVAVKRRSESTYR